jgi:RNA polymerase sigma-32 factor
MAKKKGKVTSKAAKPRTLEAKRVTAEIVEDSDQSTDIESNLETPSIDEEAYSGAGLDSDEDLNLEKTVAKNLPATAATKSLTTADPITAYLAEIRKYPLLSKEKEQELTKKYYDTKDPMIAQILVTSNLRFVVKIAAEYSKFGARLIDLIQEGNMGLMHGVREFNPYKGVRLITYAVWWIRGYIQEYLMKQYSLVKIGTTQNQKKLFYQLQRQKAELDAMGKTPDIKTLSEKLGIPEDEVAIMANRMSGRDVSLDRPLDEDSDTRAMDLQKGDSMSPDDELARREELYFLSATIESLKPHLSEREKIILDERILADEPLTLQEIGEKYGITREAVRQMEARLMKKIKETFEKNQT